MNRISNTLLRALVLLALTAGAALSAAPADGQPTFAETARTIGDTLKTGKDLAPFVDPLAPCVFTQRFVDEGGKATVKKTGPLPGARILKIPALRERLRIVKEDMEIKGPEVTSDEKTMTVTYEGYSGYWNLKMQLKQTPAGWRIVAFEAYDEAP